MSHPRFPHGPWHPVTEGLWMVTGSQDLPIPRNMIVWRTAQDELVIYSGVALGDDAMAELEGWGTPRHLVVPHYFHVRDAAWFAHRYPQMDVYALPDAAGRLPEDLQARVRPPRDLTACGLQVEVVPGMKYGEVMLAIPVSDTWALVFTDVFSCGRAPQLVARWLGPPRGLGVPRVVKFGQVGDKAAVKAFFRDLPGRYSPLRWVLSAHGEVFEGDGAEALALAADRL